MNRETVNTLNSLDTIFDKKSVEERRELAKLAKLFAKNAFEQIHYWEPKTQDEKTAKAAAHGIIGEISSRIAGNPSGSGFYAGMTNKMLVDEAVKLTKGNPDQMQWVSAALGATVNAGLGKDASIGAGVAQSGTKNNDSFEEDVLLAYYKGENPYEKFLAKQEEIKDDMKNDYSYEYPAIAAEYLPYVTVSHERFMEGNRLNEVIIKNEDNQLTNEKVKDVAILVSKEAVIQPIEIGLDLTKEPSFNRVFKFGNRTLMGIEGYLDDRSEFSESDLVGAIGVDAGKHATYIKISNSVGHLVGTFGSKDISIGARVFTMLSLEGTDAMNANIIGDAVESLKKYFFKTNRERAGK